ncbi:TetR/AcrR family transcriptional regulator (plasmid) [Roseomonas marmotae]|uniref:TetR/AcrR family transcriptional regulator n=2 Tax=Roseomonas marmotae TaxID=2768161 RepID=A0ABS3KAS1_9PROT|nr:TetR/AcrR family transcriptional regulator [Roseomonas marmotae]QTI81745.1 TetR/AcrR family transcriptional regulator [Roseomonas marmotae]
MEQPEPSERILQILTEAARLFGTAGYDGTSMRDIANACGISKSLLYHHFADKDEIFARIALGSTRELYEFVAARIPEDVPPSRRIREFMVATAEYFQRYRWAWIASTSSFWSDPEARRQKERMMWRDRYEGLLRALLTDAIKAGEVRQTDVSTAGRLILSSLNWMHRWYSPGKGLSAVQIVEMYFDIIFNGLKAEPAPR